MKKAIRQSRLSMALHGVSILLPVLVAAMFINAAGQSNRVITAMQNQYNVADATDEFVNSVTYLSRQARAYATTGDSTYLDLYMEELNQTQSREANVRKISSMGLEPQVQQLLTGMITLSNEMVATDAAAFQLVVPGEGGREAIDLVYSEEYKQKVIQILQDGGELKAMTEQGIHQAVQKAIALRKFSGVAVLIILFAACLFQVAHAYETSRNLIRPLKIVTKEMYEIARGNLASELPLREDTSEMGELAYSINRTKAELKKYIGDISSKLDAMAQGDMTVRCDQEYIGDFAPMCRSLETILDALNQMLMEINEASIQIASSSKQMSQSSQDLATGAQQQAASSMMMHDSIASIADKTAEDVGFVEIARQNIHCSGANVRLSNDKMQALVQAIDEINRTSEDIIDIVNYIDEIAFHTNILSMNAAVEAAHAGQLGKGFAVVAEEVRVLSSKSARAAKDAATLIERNAVAVKNGKSIARSTADALTEVISTADEVIGSIDSINENCKHRLRATQEIQREMRKIADVVQTNSATAQETAASGHELAVQSQALKTLTQRFRLRGYSYHRPVERETEAAKVLRGAEFDENKEDRMKPGEGEYPTGFAIR